MSRDQIIGMSYRGISDIMTFYDKKCESMVGCRAHWWTHGLYIGVFDGGQK